MRLLSKKGNVGLALTGVTVLFIAAFLFVMGLIMMDELYVEVSSTGYSVSNETVSSVDATDGAAVARAGRCGFRNFAVTTATNKTSGEVITSGNYTTDAITGIITAVSGAEYEDLDWNVTYTYSSGEGTEVCEATNASIAGQGKFGDYVDLIVLAIVITIIISLILVGFAARKIQ